MNSIVVFCGSSVGNAGQFTTDAWEVGQIFVERGIQLVYGGARIGIMGKLAESTLASGGRVIGVIPEFLKMKEVFHEGLTQLIVTQNMHDRKLKMHELSDGILMLPGGFGTLEEFFEMSTWAQLGLHQYPIGILNTNGFYDPLLEMMQRMVDKGFVKNEYFESIMIDTDIRSLLDKMENHQPLPVPKWIHKEQL